MSNQQDSINHRRKFLKLLSGSVVFIPLAGIQGCAKEPEPAASKAAATPDSKPHKMPPHKEDAKPAAMADSKTPPPDTGKALPQLGEDDPQAIALGYKHDATEVDAARYPRFEAGQNCKNCALFAAKGDEEWAGCSIFPGKSVNAKGWCGVYAPKA